MLGWRKPNKATGVNIVNNNKKKPALFTSATSPYRVFDLFEKEFPLDFTNVILYGRRVPR